jgi:hypothetical protein
MNIKYLSGKLVKGTILVAVAAFVSFGAFAPKANAGFDILDPFGFFDDNEYADNFLGIPLPPLPGLSGDFDGDTVYNNVNSNNTNSNVNSPGGVVNNNSGSGTQTNTNNNTGGNTTNTADNYPLSVSCDASRSNIDEGDSVTWSANVSGGTTRYTYSWSGTDGLSGSGSSVTKTYHNEGTKRATVRVSDSGGRSISKQCSDMVYVENDYDHDDDDDNDYDDYDDLTVRCYPSSSRVDEGDTVRWYADADGGDGDYDYDWEGTNNLSGSSRSVSKRYTSEGTKRAEVTVRSDDGQEETRSCGTVRVEEEYDNDDDDYDADYDTPNTGAIACYASVASTQAGSPITWISNVPSTYYVSWSGTDGLYGSGSSLRTTYLKPGAKSAQITVTAPNGQVAARACSNTVTVIGTYSAPKPAYKAPVAKKPAAPVAKASTLAATCIANVDFAVRGDTVVWAANVTGGNGSIKYIWSGSEGLSGQAIATAKAYRTDGIKTAAVTVISGNQTTNASCDNYVMVGEGESDAAASIFSLAQIPWGFISFLIILILIFALAYMLFNKNKI